MTKQEQIDNLQNQIHAIKDNMREENRVKILPLLKQDGIRLIYGGFHDIQVKGDEDKLTALIEIMSKAAGDGGYYHFGTALSEKTEIRFDDHVISISMNFSGHVKDLTKNLLAELKLLGLKVDFNDAKGKYMNEIAAAQRKIADLNLLDKETNG